MKDVLYIQRFADGFLANCINDKDVKQQVAIIETRGAVVSPIDEHPGYYLFFGMTKHPNIFKKHPLLFLCEAEHTTHGQLIEALFNDASRMKASVIYSNRGSSRKQQAGFYRDVWTHRVRQNVPLRVMPAPSVKDVDYGRGIIQDWTREDAIVRPKKRRTVLARQMTEEMREQVVDPAEDRWYAFHALRYLIAGFIKDPPLSLRAHSTPWGDRFDDISVPASPIGQQAGNRLGAWT
uniref:Terminase n=1 Tax=viral metagenome TaxID=1070528 RepID=A0A6M3IK38_9ZZZZ